MADKELLNDALSSLRCKPCIRYPKGMRGEWLNFTVKKKNLLVSYHLHLNFKKKKIISWTNLYKSAIPTTHDCFFIYLLMYLFYVYWSFACMFACVPHPCLLLTEVKRGHQITGIQIIQLGVALWVLEIELGSTGRAASGLNYWAISESWNVIFQSLFPDL